MKYNNIVLILILAIFCIEGYGQHIPIHSYNSDFFNTFNPASQNNYYLLLGQNKNSITSFYRNQWSNSSIEGAPETFGISGNWWSNKNLNWKGNLLVDRAGAISLQEGFGALSYEVTGYHDIKNKGKQKGSLHIGIGANYGGYNINRNKIDEYDPGDPVLVNTTLLESGYVKGTAGIYGHRDLKKGKRKITVFGGVSYNHFFVLGSEKLSLLEKANHFYLNAGLLYEFSKNPGYGRLHFIEGSYIQRLGFKLGFIKPFLGSINLRYHAHFADRGILTVGLGHHLKSSLQFECFYLYKGIYGAGFNFDLLGNDVLQRPSTLEFRLIFMI